MIFNRTAFLSLWVFCAPIISKGQAEKPDMSIYKDVKDSIVARYNRQDFKGIYQLSDTSFSNKISEQQLVNFLTNNFSTGKIIASSLYKETVKGKQYLLETQARNMVMILDVTSDRKIKSFGLTNYPTIMRETPINLQSNNVRKSKLDLAIDSIAKEYFKFPNAVSLSIGIIKNGQPFNYHYGETKKGNMRLPDLQTGYQIASVSKTFTATLLAQAVIDGKIKLSDDIRNYLPGTYPNLEFNGEPITILTLANHTSGLPNIPDNYAEQPSFDPLNTLANYNLELFSEALHNTKISYHPGSKFNYSNMGIDLLGLILERAYGSPYAKLLAKHITDPFSMVNTKISLSQEDKSLMAQPYGNSGKEVPFWISDVLPGAGGLTSTTADMLRYLENQINETTAAIRLTHQLTMNSTGLAWGVRVINNVRDLQHSGGGVGYRSNVTFYPELKSGAVILINNDSDTDVMNRLVIAVQNIVKSPLYR